MKFFDTSFGKFLIVLAVFAIGIYWLYAIAPPPTTTSPGALPEYRSEMRYCFAEEIRLDGARSVLKQAESADIERFNRMVDAYNQSCGNLRERRRNFAIVEAIQSEVRANRNALWAEGIALSGRREVKPGGPMFKAFDSIRRGAVEALGEGEEPAAPGSSPGAGGRLDDANVHRQVADAKAHARAVYGSARAV